MHHFDRTKKIAIIMAKDGMLDFDWEGNNITLVFCKCKVSIDCKHCGEQDGLKISTIINALENLYLNVCCYDIQCNAYLDNSPLGQFHTVQGRIQNFKIEGGQKMCSAHY